MYDYEAHIRALTHINQMQARLIEKMVSRGIFGWFQRRRVRKMREAGEVSKYLREDSLRAENIELKARLRS